MVYDFDEIILRTGTDSEKWESGGHADVPVNERSLSFSIADMDFACAPQILDAIRARLDKRILGYTGTLSPRYKKAVCNWVARRFGAEVNPERIRVFRGVMDGINRCLRRLMQPGQGLIIQTPVYPPFLRCAKTVDAKLVINKLVEKDGRWQIDFEDLKRLAADENNKVLLLCSPHNPVGRVWTEEELRKIGDICAEHGIVLISDEIHCDIVRRGVKHIPSAKVIKNADVITCISVSKSFNLPGLEFATLLFNNENILQRAETPNYGGAGNPLSIEGTIAAYEKAEDWLDAMNAYVDGNMLYIKNWLEKNLPDVKFAIPEGTYLAWFDIRAYTRDAYVFSHTCGAEYDIILEPGEVFGSGGEGFIRFNCAAPRSVLEEGLKRFKAALESLRN